MCVALSSVETILILVRHGSALARPELLRVRFGLLLRLSACAERYPKWARGGASDRERESECAGAGCASEMKRGQAAC